VVAPRDAAIFSADAFAFAEANQDSVTALMARTLPDGGGDTFYNLAPPGGPDARGWIDLVGARIDPRVAGEGAFSAWSGGIEAGADVALSGAARLGGSFGYESSRLSDTEGGSAHQDLYRLSLYGSADAGPVGLSADVTYAHSAESLERAAGFGVSASSRGVDEVAGALQAAAPQEVGGATITPAAGVLFAHISAQAFGETDARSAAFAVTGAAASASTVSPYAQVSVSRMFTTADGLKLTPDAELGYRYDPAAAGLGQTLIAPDGTVFAGNRLGLSRSSALLGASLTAHKGTWTAFVRYRATVASGWNDQSAQIGVRVAF
jgi:hypothetical protein